MDNDQTTQHNEVMNGDEAAVFLKMPKSTLLKLCSEGQLPGVKVGRQWRFHRDALENWKREKAGEPTILPDETEGVGEPKPIDFSANLRTAEARLEQEIKPVVDEIVGSVGGDDFESVGEVRELDEVSDTGDISEVGEVTEIPEETIEKTAPKSSRRPAARSTSALDLMAQISEKSQGRKPSRTARSKPAEPVRETRPPHSPTAQAAAAAPAMLRETVRDGGSEAVEISRPYNKPGSMPRPETPRQKGGAFELARKLSYWIVVLAVLAFAGLGVKGLLLPLDPLALPGVIEPAAPAVPTLPEFQVVYKHNEPDEPGQENFSLPTPQAPQSEAPAALAETSAEAATPPGSKPAEPLLAPEVAAQTSTPITTAQPTDGGLESINRLLPALYDLSGCAITSTNNEIRIAFQDGLFASGVKIDRTARERLARVAEFLAANAGDFWVIIEGQTDGTAVRRQSPFRDNYTLGLRRAVAATEVMREDAGFPPDRLLASSAGGMAPLFAMDTPGAAARNRTVLLRLIPKAGPLPTAGTQQ